MRKCVKCDKPATVTFGNDPDLKGVPSCDEHKEAVRLALLLSLTENTGFEKALKALK